ncbi:cytosol aminopeptidase family, catalytic domain-containing protein [Armillaria novae-zelandiae]|uniref:Cytosol aminopeptidase family, catalytic domain-containing protein n=1 Tax=Armillaria novae-zelandiae TaxID=153914 RepID=A0AA39NWF3_9AGAR|nr:cytosol aminopeptidase family, catalytic domain-containing protein [Armillaria novae-zelandiae]
MSTARIVPHDPKSTSELWASAPTGEKPAKVGTTRIFYNTPPQQLTALSSLGDGFGKKTGTAKREVVRKAVGSAVKAVKAIDGVKSVKIDASLDPHAAAVAAHLAQYSFTLKTSPTPSRFDPNLKEPIPEKLTLSPEQSSEEWDRGVVYAESQNFARTLMELPANILTPTVSLSFLKSAFAGIDNVEILVRDEAWAEAKGMRTFLSVTHGTAEARQAILTIYSHYKGAPSKDDIPVAFVGKGITFDSGGISLKPSAGMKLMRGDMGGAASVVAAALAIAKLKLPVNLITITPLTENLPGPSATKPGDIIYAMNGKTVEVDNTDAEGRLVLADAIYYASSEYKPHTLIDVATLTGAMDIALGDLYSGVFTTSDQLWDQLRVAGETEFDRFWRMPLDDDYGPQIYSSNADLCNTGGRPAGSCTAALFLKAFVEGIDGDKPSLKWAHIDIAGTMEAIRPTPYLEKGMTGRSVRYVL